MTITSLLLQKSSDDINPDNYVISTTALIVNMKEKWRVVYEFFHELA